MSKLVEKNNHFYLEVYKNTELIRQYSDNNLERFQKIAEEIISEYNKPEIEIYNCKDIIKNNTITFKCFTF
jgi:monomeric isocitrate dehydrogenase